VLDLRRVGAYRQGEPDEKRRASDETIIHDVIFFQDSAFDTQKQLHLNGRGSGFADFLLICRR